MTILGVSLEQKQAAMRWRMDKAVGNVPPSSKQPKEIRLHDQVLRKVAAADEDFEWRGPSIDPTHASFHKLMEGLFGSEYRRVGYIPDAYCVNAASRQLWLLEVENTSTLHKTNRRSAIAELWWLLDSESWSLGAVTVNIVSGARHEFDDSRTRQPRYYGCGNGIRSRHYGHQGGSIVVKLTEISCSPFTDKMYDITADATIFGHVVGYQVRIVDTEPHPAMRALELGAGRWLVAQPVFVPDVEGSE